MIRHSPELSREDQLFRGSAGDLPVTTTLYSPFRKLLTPSHAKLLISKVRCSGVWQRDFSDRLESSVSSPFDLPPVAPSAVNTILKSRKNDSAPGSDSIYYGYL